MALKTKILVGLAALLALLIVAVATGWSAGLGNEPPRRETTASHPATETALLEAPPGEPAAERSELSEPAEPALLTPYLFTMEIHVRDEDDLPAADATVWIAPERHDLNRADTGKDGVLRVSWRGRTPVVTMVFTSPADLTSGHRLQRRQVRAGEPAVVTLRVRRRRSMSPRILGVVTVGWTLVTPSGSLLVQGVPRLQVDEDGTCRFAIRTQQPANAQLISRQLFSYGQPRANLVELSLISPASDQPKGPRSRLTGRIVDSLGQPVAKALVLVGPEVDRHGQWFARTSDDGTYEIKGLPPGAYHLRAGGGDHGLASDQLMVGDGQDLVWNGRLDRGLELRARLVDEQGQPLQGFHIEAVPAAPGDPWLDGTTTDGEGRFSIPNVIDRAYRVRAWPPKGALTVWTADVVLPGREHLFTVDALALAEASLTIRAQLPGARPYDRARVRLWADDRDEGLSLKKARRARKGTLTAEHLPPGLYRLLASGIGIAWQDATQAQLLPGESADLGSFELPEPGTVSLPETANLDGHALGLRFLHDAVVSSAGELTAEQRRLMVPPGSYLVGTGATERGFDVAPGPNLLPMPKKK